MAPVKHITSIRATLAGDGAAALGFRSPVVYLTLILRKPPSEAPWPLLMINSVDQDAPPAGLSLGPGSVQQIAHTPADAAAGTPPTLRLSFVPPCQPMRATATGYGEEQPPSPSSALVSITLTAALADDPAVACMLSAFSVHWRGTADLAAAEHRGARGAGAADDDEEEDGDDVTAGLASDTPKGLVPTIGPYVRTLAVWRVCGHAHGRVPASPTSGLRLLPVAPPLCCPTALRAGLVRLARPGGHLRRQRHLPHPAAGQLLQEVRALWRRLRKLQRRGPGVAPRCA